MSQLTNDERKAFEAAFQNLPVDHNWSASAIHIYYETRRVMGDPQLTSKQEIIDADNAYRMGL